MLAFHNDASLKKFIVAQLEQHKAADKIVHGQYWQDGKGCAVGCTLEAVRVRLGDKNIDHSGHDLYETHLGIPCALARLEDHLFERLENGTAKDWPLRFTSAIQPGADLSMVIPNFLFWMLSERLPKHVNKEKFPKSWQSIADVAALYREWCVDGVKPSRERFVEARANCRAYAYAADAAYAAYAADAAYADAADAYAAAAAAAYAADAAYAAYAADAAYADAADAYADAADAYAAAAAAYAAYAADAADAYDAAADAYDARSSRAQTARSEEYKLMADKLVELLASAPIKEPEAKAA